jgi:predicted TIM-barrel enzyme
MDGVGLLGLLYVAAIFAALAYIPLQIAALVLTRGGFRWAAAGVLFAVLAYELIRQTVLSQLASSLPMLLTALVVLAGDAVLIGLTLRSRWR